MTLEELLNEWEQDAPIKRTDITSEALNSPKLHSKYYRIYMGERARLIGWMNQLKQLKFNKFEFYTEGPNSETPSGWALPAKGRVLKADVDRYLDADKDLLDLTQKVDLQKEKVKMIESIISSISFRNNSIKNAIEMIKFESGG